MPDILANCNRFTYLDRPLYGYRDTPTGIVRTANAKAHHDQIDFLLNAGRYVENPAEKKLHHALILSHLVGIAKDARKLPHTNDSEFLKDRIISIILNMGIINILFNKNIRFNKKKRLLIWYTRNLVTIMFKKQSVQLQKASLNRL